MFSSFYAFAVTTALSTLLHPAGAFGGIDCSPLQKELDLLQASYDVLQATYVPTLSCYYAKYTVMGAHHIDYYYHCTSPETPDNAIAYFYPGMGEYGLPNPIYQSIQDGVGGGINLFPNMQVNPTNDCYSIGLIGCEVEAIAFGACMSRVCSN